MILGQSQTPANHPHRPHLSSALIHPYFAILQITPGQVTPGTRVSTPEVPALQTPEAPAASLSSPSANNPAILNEYNNSFKRVDCTPACPPAIAISSSSTAVSTLLSTTPVPQVTSLSHPFHHLWGITAHALAVSHPPHHPSDHVTATSVISGTEPTQQSSAMLKPPHHLLDHVTSTSAVHMPLPSEQQASITHTCAAHSSAYNTSMLDIYRGVTACDSHCPSTSPSMNGRPLHILGWIVRWYSI